MSDKERAAIAGLILLAGAAATVGVAAWVAIVRVVTR